MNDLIQVVLMADPSCERIGKEDVKAERPDQRQLQCKASTTFI